MAKIGTYSKATPTATDLLLGTGVGGLVAGELFQTTGAGAAQLNAAGIVMIKQ